MGVVCDVTDEDQVVAAIAQATERFGGIDILANGAALFNFKGVLDMPLDEWRRQTDIILTGAFLFTKHVAHQMIEQERQGNIINIISTAGHQGEPGNVGYGTAKAGLLNFTRSVAMELSRYGIRVNSLTPTATNATEGRERAERWGVEWPRPRGGQRAAGLLPDASRGAPLLRLPGPSHYGKAAVFLASDDAEMITGFDLRVDAGAVSKLLDLVPGGRVISARPTGQLALSSTSVRSTSSASRDSRSHSSHSDCSSSLRIRYRWPVSSKLSTVLELLRVGEQSLPVPR